MPRRLARCACLGFWLLACAAGVDAEVGVQLRLLPPQEYSDPLGLTFEVVLSPEAQASDPAALTVDALWLPAGWEVADPRLGDEAQRSALRSGHWLVSTPHALYLHVRRVPGQPALPGSRLLLRLRHPEWGLIEIVPALPASLDQRPVDVLLVLDESLSMRKNDGERLRVAAAKTFADLATGGERIGRIGLVAFNHGARRILPLSPVAEKAKIFAAADEIGTIGETDMDGALSLAFRELSSGADTEKVAILLTDGKDQPGVYEDAHRAFAERGWPVHTIGLSPKADHETLKRIAAETGGSYHDAPTSGELPGIFGRICFALQNRSLLRRASMPLGAGHPGSFSLALDRTVRNVTLAAHAGVRVEHQFFGPGEVLTAGLVGGGEVGYRYWDLWNPRPGVWKMETRPEEGQPESVLRVEATAVTPLNFWLFPLAEAYEWGEPISCVAGLARDNAALEGASVSARVRFPDGSVRDCPFLRDGPLYRVRWDGCDQTGTYELSVRAAGALPEGDAFEREVPARFQVVETRSPRLWLGAARLDFGSLCPGDIGSCSFDAKMVTAKKLEEHPLEVHRITLEGPEGSSLPAEAFQRIPDPFRLSSRGPTRLSVQVRIPDSQRPGDYAGALLLRRGAVQGLDPDGVEPPATRMPIHLRVEDAALRVDPGEFDAGSLQTGQAVPLKLRAWLEPGGELPATLRLERSDRDETPEGLEVTVPEGEVLDAALTLDPPGPWRVSRAPQEVVMSLRIGRHARPGLRRWTLILEAGDRRREIPVRFSLRWPELAVEPLVIDFGQVLCGGAAESVLKVTHDSRYAESLSAVPLETEPAAEASLHCGATMRTAAAEATGRRSETSLTLKIAPPATAKPGPYSGRLRVSAWFGHRDIPWKARIAASRGFTLSAPAILFPSVAPGTVQRATVSIASTLPVGQTVTLRALAGELSAGVGVRARPSRLELGAGEKREIEVELTAAADAAATPVSFTYQVRGPYNSVSLAVRAEVETLPKPEAAGEHERDAPEPQPEPVFTVRPDSVDFGEVRPGESRTAVLQLGGDRSIDFAARVEAVPERGVEVRLSASSLAVSPGEDSRIEVLLAAGPSASAGEWRGRALFTNGDRSLSVSLRARVVVPEPLTIASVPEGARPEASLPPAAPAARWALPSWLRYVLLALLVLAVLGVLIGAFRWIFTIELPEMTRFYLASALLHVVFAVFAAFHYLQAKIAVVEEPERLRVQLVQEAPKADAQRVLLESPALPTLAPGQIPIASAESETRAERAAAAAASGEKTAARTEAVEEVARAIELERRAEEKLQELASGAAFFKREMETPQVEPSRPRLEVSLQETRPPEEPVDAREMDRERAMERPALERSKPEVERSERLPEAADLAKPDEASAPFELAEAQPSVASKAEARPEEVEASVDRPAERSADSSTETERMSAQDIPAYPAASAPAGGKANASIPSHETLPLGTELAQPVGEQPAALLHPASAAAAVPAGSMGPQSPVGLSTPSVPVKSVVHASGGAGEEDAATDLAAAGRASPAPGGRRAVPEARHGEQASPASWEADMPVMAEIREHPETVPAIQSHEGKEPGGGAALPQTAEPVVEVDAGRGVEPSPDRPKSPGSSAAEAGERLLAASVPAAAVPGAARSRARNGAGREAAPSGPASDTAMPAVPPFASSAPDVHSAPALPAGRGVAPSSPESVEMTLAAPEAARQPSTGPGDEELRESPADAPAPAVSSGGGMKKRSPPGRTGPVEGPRTDMASASPPVTSASAPAPLASWGPAVPAARSAQARSIDIPAPLKQPSGGGQTDSPASDERSPSGSALEVFEPEADMGHRAALVRAAGTPPAGRPPRRRMASAGAGTGSNAADLSAAPPWPGGDGAAMGPEMVESSGRGEVFMASARAVGVVVPGPQTPKERMRADAGDGAATEAKMVGVAVRGPRPGRGKTTLLRNSELAPAEPDLPSAIAPSAVLAKGSILSGLPLQGPGYASSAGKKMSRFVAYLARYRASNPVFDDRQRRALSFLADEVDRRLDFILSGELRTVDISDEQALFAAPWLFLTGEFDFELTEAEVSHLREYLERGGWLWVDDCTTDTDTSFDRSLHRQMQAMLPEARFGEIPMDHPVFSSCYDLSQGCQGYEIPPGDKYRENRLHAWYVQGRPAVIYSRNDYGCALEFDPKSLYASQRSLTDLSAAEMQNASVMMSMNFIFYFLGDEGGVQGLMSRVAEEAARDSRRRAEHQKKFHDLFLRGVVRPPLEDFESDTASLWKPIGEDQVTETAWRDIDLARSRLLPGAAGRHFELSYPLGKGKSAFEREFPAGLDISDVHGLLVDINNKSPALARVAAAFVTLPDWQYFESEPAFIKPGPNPNVLFLLIGPHFKSAGSGWNYQAAIEHPESVRKVLFITYAIQPGTLAFDNIRVSRVQAEDLKKMVLESASRP